MINPRIRARRLQAEYDRARKLNETSGLIQVESVAGDPPEFYIVRYTCRGIARVVGDRPVYSDLHRVALRLTDAFPTDKPLMEWLTPIFHPNILANGQEVCIGTWYPAKTLDELLVMLGEMIQYKNYASYDPLHLEASLWAMEHKQLFPVDDRPLLETARTTGVRETDIDILILGK